MAVNHWRRAFLKNFSIATVWAVQPFWLKDFVAKKGAGKTTIIAEVEASQQKRMKFTLRAPDTKTLQIYSAKRDLGQFEQVKSQFVQAERILAFESKNQNGLQVTEIEFCNSGSLTEFLDLTMGNSCRSLGYNTELRESLGIHLELRLS